MESLRVINSGSRRFRLEGELCLGTAEILREAMQREADEGDLTLELDELTFLDSTGLRELLEVLKRLQVTGSTLILERPQGIVRKVLSLTKVDSRPDVRVTADSESPQANDLPVA